MSRASRAISRRLSERKSRRNPATLQDAAEAWARKRGLSIPSRSSPASRGLFDAWVRHGMARNPVFEEMTTREARLGSGLSELGRVTLQVVDQSFGGQAAFTRKTLAEEAGPFFQAAGWRQKRASVEARVGKALAELRQAGYVESIGRGLTAKGTRGEERFTATVVAGERARADRELAQEREAEALTESEILKREAAIADFLAVPRKKPGKGKVYRPTIHRKRTKGHRLPPLTRQRIRKAGYRVNPKKRKKPGLSVKARAFLKRKFRALTREGYRGAQRIAVALKMARKAGFKVKGKNPLTPRELRLLERSRKLEYDVAQSSLSLAKAREGWGEGKRGKGGAHAAQREADYHGGIADGIMKASGLVRHTAVRRNPAKWKHLAKLERALNDRWRKAKPGSKERARLERKIFEAMRRTLRSLFGSRKNPLTPKEADKFLTRARNSLTWAEAPKQPVRSRAYSAGFAQGMAHVVGDSGPDARRRRYGDALMVRASHLAALLTSFTDESIRRDDEKHRRDWRTFRRDRIKKRKDERATRPKRTVHLLKKTNPLDRRDQALIIVGKYGKREALRRIKHKIAHAGAHGFRSESARLQALERQIEAVKAPRTNPVHMLGVTSLVNPRAKGRRDKKRDPRAGDVIRDGGVTYEVLRAYRDSKGRNVVEFEKRFKGEPRGKGDRFTNGLGGWRHRWGRLEGQKRNPKKNPSQKGKKRARKAIRIRVYGDLPKALKKKYRRAAMLAARRDHISLAEVPIVRGESQAPAPNGLLNHGDLVAVEYEFDGAVRRSPFAGARWRHASGDRGKGKKRARRETVGIDPITKRWIPVSRRGSRPGFSSRRGLIG